MLVLTRRIGETIVIGNGIKVTVADVQGNRVRLAFEAPKQHRILRAELACWLDKEATGEEPAKPASMQ